MNTPAIFASNRILSRLYVLGQAYFRKSWRRSYSQWGEDLVLKMLVPANQPGVYVDVGCYHPSRHSNTYLLHRRGWAGINIDMSELKMDVFKLARPGDENVACAVTEFDGEIEYYSFGACKVTDTVDGTYARGVGKPFQVRRVECRTLTSIIDGSRFCGQSIGFLNIDVEGHDLEVLRSLDFDKYRPRVIAVEFQAKRVQEVLESDLYAFLQGKGYSLINWVGLTLFFRGWAGGPLIPSPANSQDT